MREPTRKLAAIVFTDIVGFTKLTAEDQSKASLLLKQQRKLFQPIVAKYNGTWIKEMGDGLLLIFETVTDAVKSCLEIQEIAKLNEGLILRIGIHQGEILIEKNDILGDDVNVASRIEPFSAPGGIAISNKVNDALVREVDFTTKLIGKPKLKGVGQKVEVFCITSHGLPKTDIKKVTAKLEQTSSLKLFFVPIFGFIILLLIGILAYLGWTADHKEIRENTVAVLPFENYSSAEEDQFFSDGLTEVIIANLAKINNLKVISRTSVMGYKGSTKPLIEIGKELGVSHILEGSVQRGTERIRIVGQLIDTQTDEHIWAETYDNLISDLFDIQINVAKKIAEALKVEISTNEMSNLNKKPTENIAAWDYYLKGIEYQSKSYSAENLELAILYFNKAVESDPTFAEAYAKLSFQHIFLYWLGYIRTDERRQLAKFALDKGIELDPENPEVRIARGFYYYYGFRDYVRALEDFRFAQEKLPGNKAYNTNIGYIERRLGRAHNAIFNLETSFEFDSKNAMLAINIGLSYLSIRDFVNAEKYLKKTVIFEPDVDLYYRDLAELYYWMGNIDDAMVVLTDALKFLKSDKLLFSKALLEHLDQKYEKSLVTIQSVDLNVYEKQAQYMLIEKLIGINYYHLNNIEMANKFFNEAKSILELKIEKNPNDMRFHAEYALVLGYLGLKEEALKSAKFATAVIPIDKDASVGTQYFITLTKVLTIIGQYKNAIENLEYLRKIPYGPTLESLKLDPVWESLHNIPEFQLLLNKDYGKITS